LTSLKRYYSLIKKVTYLAEVIRIDNPQNMEGLSKNQGQRNSSSCLGQPKEKFLTHKAWRVCQKIRGRGIVVVILGSQ